MKMGLVQQLRSVLFNIVFFVGTAIGLLVMFPFIVLPRAVTMWTARALFMRELSVGSLPHGDHQVSF